MSLENTGTVGGAGPNANMAASLDDNLEPNNQDYYSLLNVRKEVRSISFHGDSERWQTFRWGYPVVFRRRSAPQSARHPPD